MDKSIIRSKFECALIAHYGDDTEQFARIRTMDSIDLEREFKEVFKIESKVSYFGG